MSIPAGKVPIAWVHSAICGGAIAHSAAETAVGDLLGVAGKGSGCGGGLLLDLADRSFVASSSMAGQHRHWNVGVRAVDRAGVDLSAIPALGVFFECAAGKGGVVAERCGDQE